jgi:hypothetical protein
MFPTPQFGGELLGEVDVGSVVGACSLKTAGDGHHLRDPVRNGVQRDREFGKALPQVGDTVGLKDAARDCPRQPARHLVRKQRWSMKRLALCQRGAEGRLGDGPPRIPGRHDDENVRIDDDGHYTCGR